jgi:hypothetical protein
VRKGLEGREAVTPTIKSMHCMDFIVGVTEPPQSPVGVAGCAHINYSLFTLTRFILIGFVRAVSVVNLKGEFIAKNMPKNYPLTTVANRVKLVNGIYR